MTNVKNGGKHALNITTIEEARVANWASLLQGFFDLMSLGPVFTAGLT